MTAPSPRRARLLVALACASLALTGCAPEPSATPVPSLTSSPPPSATVDPLPVPQPAISLACEDLVPPGLGAGLLTERLPELAAPIYGASDPALPENFATRQAGGILCSSENSEPRSIDGTQNPAWVSIQARVLPEASDGFAVLVDAQAPIRSSDTVVTCSSGQAPSAFWTSWSGIPWVTVNFYGVDPSLARDESGAPAQIADLVTGIRSVVAAAASSGTAWTRPQDAVTLSADCSVFFGSERLQADLGVDEPIYLVPYEDYISSERVARETAPALSCPWSSESRQDYGGHSVLLGGEWAFRELQSAGAFDDSESLPLTTLQERDAAVISCSAERRRCVADMVVGRHWIQVHVLYGSGPTESEARAELGALMQTALDTVLA